MDNTPLLQQLIRVAQAPMFANMAGEPLQGLGITRCTASTGLSLADWPFGEGLPRSSRGLMAAGPGLGPIAPVGIMLGPDNMPNTGYLYPLPERISGQIIIEQG